MFELTAEEAETVVPQNAAPSPRSVLGRHLPLVFTQEGIAMLSGVLRSPRAVRADIEIVPPSYMPRRESGGEAMYAAGYFGPGHV